jgi:hypothetical protein
MISLKNFLYTVQNICGVNTSGSSLVVSVDDPDYVFKPDPEFSPIRLYDEEANTVIVNSWHECSHYVNGGWTITEPNLVSNKIFYLGAFLIIILFLIAYFIIKKESTKRIFLSLKIKLIHLKKLFLLNLQNMISKKRKPLIWAFFISQIYLLFPYVKNRALSLKNFVDEYIILTSNVQFFKNLNYDAGPDWGGNFSIYLTSGPLSAVGSVIGWNITENFTITRISNFYWVLLIELLFIYVLSRKYELDSVFLIFGANTFLLLIPWWYGSLYSLGEIASMLVFTNSIFLYKKYPEVAMVFFSTSIFFGKILTALPFLGFYLFAFMKKKRVRIFREILCFLLPLSIWLIFVYFKFENGSVMEYLVQQINAITLHQSSGIENISNSYIDSFWNKLNSSEFKTWNNYDIFRLLISPIIYVVFLIKNKNLINKNFGDITFGIAGSIALPYLWFWFLSDTKWLRYSQHFAVIILMSSLLVLSSNIISNKTDLGILLALIISFIDDEKYFILIFIVVILLFRFISNEDRYRQFSKYLLLIMLTLNFLIPTKDYILNSKPDFEIKECKLSLLNIDCKDKYLNG